MEATIEVWNRCPIYHEVVKDLGDPNRTVQIARSHAQMKHDKSKAWKLTNRVWAEICNGK